MDIEKVQSYEKAWKKAISELNDEQAQRLLMVLLEAEKYRKAR